VDEFVETLKPIENEAAGTVFVINAKVVGLELFDSAC